MQLPWSAESVQNAAVAVGLGTAIVVLLAWIAAGLLPRAIWRRQIWQAAILFIGLLTVAEAIGISGWVSQVGFSRSETGAATIRKGVLPEQATQPASVRREADAGNSIPLQFWSHEAPRDISPLASAAGSNTRGDKLEVGPVGDAVGAPAANFTLERESLASGVSPIAHASAREVAIGPWLGLIWLVVALLLLARVGLGHCLLARFRRELMPVVNGELQTRAAELARRLGWGWTPRLWRSPRVASPMTVGCVRPVVVLPTGWEQEFTPRQLEAMLAHELAHALSRDPLWQFGADVLCAILWWQPAAWWARLQLRGACEAAADEASLVLADGPGALAACLVRLGRKLRRPRPGLVAATGSGFRSSLGRRVQRLLQLKGAWRRPRAAWGAALVACCPFLFVSIVGTTSVFRLPSSSTGETHVKTLGGFWKHSLAGAVLTGILSWNGMADAQEGPPNPRDEEVEARHKEGERRGDARRAGERPRADGERRPEAARRPEGEHRPEGDRPEVARMRERLAQLRREIGERAAAGRKEQVEELEREVRRLEDAMARAARGPAGRPDRPGQPGRPGEPDRPHEPGRPGEDRRAHHLRVAAENLRAAGLPDLADEVLRHAGEAGGAPDARRPDGGGADRPIAGQPGRPGVPHDFEDEAPVRPGQPGAPHDLGPMLRQLAEQVRQLRGEVNDLRNQVRELSGKPRP